MLLILKVDFDRVSHVMRIVYVVGSVISLPLLEPLAVSMSSSMDRQ